MTELNLLYTLNTLKLIEARWEEVKQAGRGLLVAVNGGKKNPPALST